MGHRSFCEVTRETNQPLMLRRTGKVDCTCEGRSDHEAEKEMRYKEFVQFMDRYYKEDE